MVAKKWNEADCKHYGNEKQEKYMQLSPSSQFILPKQQKVMKRSDGSEEAGYESIAKELNKKFIICKWNTIIDPAK